MMEQTQVKQLKKHPVLDFASDELHWLIEMYSKEDHLMNKQWVIGTWQDCMEQARDLELLDGASSGVWPWQGDACLDYSDDAYVILRQADKIILSGKSERAVLYAVYAFAKAEWGLEWIYPGEQPIVARSEERQILAGAIIEQPDFTRRGFVYENLKDEPYLLSVVDWLAKSRINELFMTFMLWDHLGAALEPELLKRGITLTLGGHSMKFFLPQFAGKKQLDYTDMDWQTKVIADIVAYCKPIPMLTRISLWPEDAAIAEDSTVKTPFLPVYIRFTEQLRQAFMTAGFEIEVEHIAYNAGLSWDMLLLTDEMDTSSEINTLFAYWGRDYSQEWNEQSRVEDARAYQALERWTSQTKRHNKHFTVFEYYSDHFMLSPLFPNLPERVQSDLAAFRSLGIDQITNLVVPEPKSDDYSWKWAQGFNSYLFARLTWGDNHENVLHDYWQYAPATDRDFLRAAMDKVGESLSRITSFNIPLFPSRVVDVKQIHRRPIETAEITRILTGLLNDLQYILDYLQIKANTDFTPFEMYFKHLYRVSQDLDDEWKMKG